MFYSLDVTPVAQDIYSMILLSTMAVLAVLMKFVIYFTTFPKLPALNQGHETYLWLPYLYRSMNKRNVYYFQDEALKSSVFFPAVRSKDVLMVQLRGGVGEGGRCLSALIL